MEFSTIPPYLTALYSIKDGYNQEAYEIIRSVVIIFQIDHSFPDVRNRFRNGSKIKKTHPPEASDSRGEASPSNENVTHSEAVVYHHGVKHAEESIRFDLFTRYKQDIVRSTICLLSIVSSW